MSINRDKILTFPVKETETGERSSQNEEKSSVFLLADHPGFAVRLRSQRFAEKGGKQREHLPLGRRKNRELLDLRERKGQTGGQIPEKSAGKEGPDWTAQQAELPLYGISVDTANGTGLKAFWTGGYWIDQEGNAWTFDFDFERLIADTQWHSVREYDHISVPCCRYVAQNGDSWNTAFLNPAEEPQIQPGISMTVKEQQADALVAELRNDGSAQWEYGEHWNLEVSVEGHWYDVPTLPGNWAFHDIAYPLSPGQAIEEIFRLDTMYGDLPPGRYRVVQNGLTAEFTLE